MKNLLLIKLGGSLITDKSKDYTARPAIIRQLAKEIKLARKQYQGDLIIVHGSGSFAHTPAAKYHTKDGLINKNSFRGLPIVADAAIQINRLVVQGFLQEKLPVVSFSPASFILASGQKTKSAEVAPLVHALDLGFLPVLYGDIIFDHKQGFCIYSAEKTITLLSQKLSNKYSKINLIFCGDTDGVYDDQKKTLPTITPSSFSKLKKFITGSGHTDVTGGMIHKVTESIALARRGIQTLIISGHRKGELKRAILGQPTSGTIITSP